MITPTDDDHDPNDGCVLPNISRKEVFQAIVTLNNYLIQHEKNVLDIMHALQKKIKDNVEFNLGTKKKQMTLNTYFIKELN